MSENYDSILKDKKRYKEPKKKEKKHKFLKRSLFIGTVLGLFVLLISYIIYYNTILGSESLFINNISTVFLKYSKIWDDLMLDNDLSNHYTFEGKITLDNQSYDYTLIRDVNQTKKTLVANGQEITYYTDKAANYLKIPKLQEYYVSLPESQLYTIEDYQNEISSFIKDSYHDLSNFLFYTDIPSQNERLYNWQNISFVLDTIEANFNNTIQSSQYIKRFYVKDRIPIVEVNLELSKGDLDKILANTNLQIKDNYNMIVTMKNNALTNQIHEIKIIVKNSTQNKRYTIVYNGNDFLLTMADYETYKISFSMKGKNNIIKFYKNQELYSILMEEKEEDIVRYNYQVINQYYNVKITKKEMNHQYCYTIGANINDKESQIQLEGTYLKEAILKEDVSNTISYQVLDNSKKQFIHENISSLLFGNEY